MIFKDREDAGRQLVKLLADYRHMPAVVLALPRGGVPVAKEISESLKLPLDIVLVRKIGHPFNPEYAIGAIAENGQAVWNDTEIQEIDSRQLNKKIQIEKLEIRRRAKLYRGGRPLINLKDKITILVDDGLATGLTMLAAIKAVKSQKPQEIIVAVAVAPKEVVDEINQMVDEFVALNIPEVFQGAVGSYYQSFPQLTDGEVIKLLKDEKHLRRLSYQY